MIIEALIKKTCLLHFFCEIICSFMIKVVFLHKISLHVKNMIGVFPNIIRNED